MTRGVRAPALVSEEEKKLRSLTQLSKLETNQLHGQLATLE